MNDLIANEPVIRLTAFFGILAVMINNQDTRNFKEKKPDNIDSFLSIESDSFDYL